jgi:hypothetical protein
MTIYFFKRYFLELTDNDIIQEINWWLYRFSNFVRIFWIKKNKTFIYIYLHIYHFKKGVDNIENNCLLICNYIMSHKKINDCTLTSKSVTFISNSSQINDKLLYHNKMSIIINQCKIIQFLIDLIMAQKNNFNNSS